MSRGPVGPVLMHFTQRGPFRAPLSLWRTTMPRPVHQPKKLEADDSMVVLFGTDDHGKPRAARFEGVSSDLIKKAAAAMKLQILRPQSTNQIELANKLPTGRIHTNGTGSVPPVRTGLYAELQLAAGEAYPEAGLPR